MDLIAKKTSNFHLFSAYSFLARFRALMSQSYPFLRLTTIKRRVFAKIIKNGLCLDMLKIDCTPERARFELTSRIKFIYLEVSDKIKLLMSFP